MKKLFVLIALLSTVLATNAQYRNGNDRVYTSNDRQNNDWRNDSRSRNGSNTAMINSFQRDAREHIAKGIIEGTITSREAAKLLEIAEQIENKENKYMRRGGLDRREAAELRNDLERLDRQILRERRDNDRMNIDRRNQY